MRGNGEWAAARPDGPGDNTVNSDGTCTDHACDGPSWAKQAARGSHGRPRGVWGRVKRPLIGVAFGGWGEATDQYVCSIVINVILRPCDSSVTLAAS